MNELFYRPSSLFSTEAVLIEALRKRSDREITKRDELIAEYQKRLALRDAAQRSLESSPGPVAKEAGPDSRRSLAAAAAETPSAPEPPASGEAEARLKGLGDTAALDALDAQRLARGLEGVAELLGAGDLQGAQDRVDSLRRDPALRSRPDSRLESASLGLLGSLSAGIAELRSAREQEAPSRTDDLATIERIRSELGSLGGQLAAAREEAGTLRATLLLTQAERDRSAADLAAARTAFASLEASARSLRERLALAEPETRPASPAPASAEREIPAASPVASAPGAEAGALIVPTVPLPNAMEPAAPAAAAATPSDGSTAASAPSAASGTLAPPTAARSSIASASVSGPTAPPASISTSAGLPPRGVFFGSVSLVLGDHLLVDLAEGSPAREGQRVAIYSREDGGFVLRASGRVTSARQGTATIGLDSSVLVSPEGAADAGVAGPGAAPRIGLQDPVFLLP